MKITDKELKEWENDCVTPDHFNDMGVTSLRFAVIYSFKPFEKRERCPSSLLRRETY